MQVLANLTVVPRRQPVPACKHPRLRAVSRHHENFVNAHAEAIKKMNALRTPVENTRKVQLQAIVDKLKGVARDEVDWITELRQQTDNVARVAEVIIAEVSSTKT